MDDYMLDEIVEKTKERIENEKHFKGLYIKNGRKTIARP